MSDENSYILLQIKPLRIIQFIAVFLLFILVTYMISLPDVPLSTLVCVLLIVLSGLYVFITVLDIINQFRGHMGSNPMFTFALFGMLFFATAGVLLIIFCVAYTWVIITSLVLCNLLALLFFIELLCVFAYWRRKYEINKRCCLTMDRPQVQTLFQQCQRAGPEETVKHDLTTSVSSVRLPPPAPEGEVIADHTMRKISYGRRREYVDCPTSTRSMSCLEMAQVQTEPRHVRVMESQTGKNEIKETFVQTASKCDMCHQQIQPYHPKQATSARQSGYQCSQQYCVCPTFVQLVRGGVGVTCCPSCKCSAGVIQMQQLQQQQVQEQRAQHTDSHVATTSENERSEAGQVASTSVNSKQKCDKNNSNQTVNESGPRKKSDTIVSNENSNEKN